MSVHPTRSGTRVLLGVLQALVAATRGSELKVAIEPGRILVGPAGVLLSKVVDVKHFPGAKRFIVLDAGMTELMRPALYNAYHRIEPLVRRPGDAAPVDIVGPICESTDAYARDREFPPVEVGDLVIVRDVGAYGAVIVMTPHGPGGPPVYEWDEELYALDAATKTLVLVTTHTGELGGTGRRRLWRAGDFRWDGAILQPPR